MKHKFNLWNDWIYPVLAKIVGHKYGCCGKLKIGYGYIISNPENPYDLRVYKSHIKKIEILK